MALISNGEFVTDEWRRLADEEALPENGKIIVSQDRLDNALKARHANGDIGVIIDNTLEIDKLTPVLAKLGLIAIAFPSFADGRGFSLARLVRRAGYRGELRASGRLLADQYAHALGCGFDTVEIPDDLAQRQNEMQWRSASKAHQRTYQRGYISSGSILDARRKATQ
jgi:uncharacterized protein (DUF934 family)